MTVSNTSPSVHPTAIIADGAIIGDGSVVGPYSVIGPHVVLGKRNRVGSHVVLDGHTTMGDDNVVFQFASVGAAPQDLKYRGEASELRIGDRNIVREFVTLQPGTEGGGMLTSIGSRNLFMANAHVGHDSTLGDANVIANSVAIAGHTQIGNGVTLGGVAGIHQFVRLGDLSFIAAGAMVSKDVPPFCYAQGDRAGLAGINRIGLERKGISASDIALLKRLYRDVFFGLRSFSQRVESARTEAEGNVYALQFLDFIGQSSRGVTFPRTKTRGADPSDDAN